MNEADLEWLVARISESVRGGRSPEEAFKEYCKMFPPEFVRTALAKFEEATGRIRTLKEPTTLERRGLQNWYPGPDRNDRYWPPLHRSLLRRDEWDQASVDSLDKASTKIILRW